MGKKSHQKGKENFRVKATKRNKTKQNKSQIKRYNIRKDIKIPGRSFSRHFPQPVRPWRPPFWIKREKRTKHLPRKWQRDDRHFDSIFLFFFLFLLLLLLLLCRVHFSTDNQIVSQQTLKLHISVDLCWPRWKVSVVDLVNRFPIANKSSFFIHQPNLIFRPSNSELDRLERLTETQQLDSSWRTSTNDRVDGFKLVTGSTRHISIETVIEEYHRRGIIHETVGRCRRKLMEALKNSSDDNNEIINFRHCYCYYRHFMNNFLCWLFCCLRIIPKKK